MGTHPSNPSKDVQTQRTLLDLIQDNKALMSEAISKQFGEKLPFLFKVLSIQKALSIQAHPNKKLAKQLHEKDPKNYPDDNHKPEMTIAITPFDGLCGFRPLAEISHFLSTVRSLRKLVGDSAAKDFESTVKGQETPNSDEQVQKNKKALQTLFSALLKNEMSNVASAAKDLVKSAETDGESFAGGGGPSNGGKELADLVVRLNSQFEGDIGLFVLFFLNYVKLEIGEAMFLKADDIHAYLSGGKTPPLLPTFFFYRRSNAILLIRYHGMHGRFRQCRPRRLHPQISRHSHPHNYANLLLRPDLRAEDEARRLPIRYSQQHRLLLFVQRNTL